MIKSTGELKLRTPTPPKLNKTPPAYLTTVVSYSEGKLSRIYKIQPLVKLVVKPV